MDEGGAVNEGGEESGGEHGEGKHGEAAGHGDERDKSGGTPLPLDRTQTPPSKTKTLLQRARSSQDIAPREHSQAAKKLVNGNRGTALTEAQADVNQVSNDGRHPIPSGQTHTANAQASRGKEARKPKKALEAAGEEGGAEELDPKEGDPERGLALLLAARGLADSGGGGAALAHRLADRGGSAAQRVQQGGPALTLGELRSQRRTRDSDHPWPEEEAGWLSSFSVLLLLQLGMVSWMGALLCTRTSQGRRLFRTIRTLGPRLAALPLHGHLARRVRVAAGFDPGPPPRAPAGVRAAPGPAGRALGRTSGPRQRGAGSVDSRLLGELPNGGTA